MQPVISDKIEWVEIEKIKPHPKNPNTHTKEQIERLSKIITENGFRVPLLVSSRSGLLIAGHGRLQAAKHCGLDKLPVLLQNFQSDEQEYQHLVADNAMASWAEMDLSKINADIGELGPFDIQLLGLKSFDVEIADKFETESEPCPTCGHKKKTAKIK